jgi:uncharacterized membrane protein YfcA
VIEYSLSPLGWALACLGALLFGVSKTGLPGVSIFSVALFATLLPAREASGVVLPILIAADIVAVASYHQHAQWKYLWKLFPIAAVGIVAGYFTLGNVDSASVGKMVGAILAIMVGVHIWRKKHASEEVPTHPAFVGTVGLTGGFTTMVANAAGPIMTMFLLAMRLPKMDFMGTAAWYFLVLNVFKVPFGVDLGIINARSLAFDVPLMACSVVGALWGRKILPRLNQAVFETLALAFTALAALRLLFF